MTKCKGMSGSFLHSHVEKWFYLFLALFLMRGRCSLAILPHTIIVQFFCYFLYLTFKVPTQFLFFLLFSYSGTNLFLTPFVRRKGQDETSCVSVRSVFFIFYWEPYALESKAKKKVVLGTGATKGRHVLDMWSSWCNSR